MANPATGRAIEEDFRIGVERIVEIQLVQVDLETCDYQ
jgi:hypothetical protein